jgi:hypothetical protein
MAKRCTLWTIVLGIAVWCVLGIGPGKFSCTSIAYTGDTKVGQHVYELRIY